MPKSQTRKPKHAKPKPKKSKPWTAAEREVFLRLSEGIPNQLVADLAKRERAQVDKQGDIYGLAFGHRPCNLGMFFQSFFDLLARIAPHYGRWMRTKDEALAAADQRTPTERWQMARARRAEFELERLHGQYIAREDMHEALGAFASVLRGAGDSLQRRCGPVAYEIFSEALDIAEQSVKRVLKDAHNPDTTP